MSDQKPRYLFKLKDGQTKYWTDNYTLSDGIYHFQCKSKEGRMIPHNVAKDQIAELIDTLGIPATDDDKPSEEEEA